MRAKHRRSEKPISGVYVKTDDCGNGEKSIWLDRSHGWEYAGLGWVIPSHRRKGK